MLKILMIAALLCGCSTAAEMARPDDVAIIRGSYTKVSGIVRFLSGGTDVCQITAMENDAAMLADYAVILDSDGCMITLRETAEQ